MNSQNIGSIFLWISSIIAFVVDVDALIALFRKWNESSNGHHSENIQNRKIRSTWRTNSAVGMDWSNTKKIVEVYLFLAVSVLSYLSGLPLGLLLINVIVGLLAFRLSLLLNENYFREIFPYFSHAWVTFFLYTVGLTAIVRDVSVLDFRDHVLLIILSFILVSPLWIGIYKKNAAFVPTNFWFNSIVALIYIALLALIDFVYMILVFGFGQWIARIM